MATTPRDWDHLGSGRIAHRANTEKGHRIVHVCTVHQPTMRELGWLGLGYGHVVSDEVVYDNAELIVRAVNSLDALVELLEKQLERLGPGPDPRKLGRGQADVLDARRYEIRAALKLAKGE